MRLTVPLPTWSIEPRPDWSFVLDHARAYDRGGVDRVIMSEHVVFGEDLEAYQRPELGGDAGGRQPTGPDGLWLEPLTTLAAVAGTTSRVRLGTRVLLAALRRPVVLAKMTSSLDALSGGRLDLGVGVGWQREEYEAAGLSFEERGRLLDHSLEVCRSLWRDRVATVQSEDLAFERIHMMPKPAQEGGVPIWCSGTVNPRVARRLARFGSGWIPWGPAVTDLGPSVVRMRALVDEHGGDGAALGVFGNLRVVADGDGVDIDATMAGLREVQDAGATEVVVGRLPIPDDGDAAADFVSRFVAAFRAAVET